jgi:transcriptional regulator GlxA family with amidase domain
MDMSLYSFNKEFKEITGTTPNKFILELRLWEARRLLEEKEISSVKIVSLTVGFKDTKNFSRNFKDRFGKYPSEA